MRDIKIVQEFAFAHASTHSHFNRDRNLNRHEIYRDI